MSITVQTVIDRAMATSSKNQPGTIATSAVELLEQVQRSLQGLFSFAAAINPVRLSAREAVVGVASAWTRPAAAEAIVRIENATFGEVVVVPYDDRLAADPKPALFEFEGAFRAAVGQTNPPGATDTLTFWYAKRPIRPNPDNLTGVIDPVFPDAYLHLLTMEMAIWLSRKDGRSDEVEMFTAERNEWAQRFASWLQIGTANEQRRFGHRRHVNVDSLLPMLTGGA